MTWTYSDDPTSSSKDEVRFLVGDVNPDEQLVSDEEINYLIEQWHFPLLAAANVAEVIAGQFSAAVSIAGDGLSWQGGDLSGKYRELAGSLRRQHERKMRAAGPYAGGMRESDKRHDEQDTDLVQHHYKVGIHDNEQTDTTRIDL